jgi:hypothetical protein
MLPAFIGDQRSLPKKRQIIVIQIIFWYYNNIRNLGCVNKFFNMGSLVWNRLLLLAVLKRMPEP